MADTWTGTADSLHKAAEKAADQALGPGEEGTYEIVSIHVKAHRNQPGETGPNPIREYSVVLGPGG